VALDFTIVVRVRQRFGDRTDAAIGLENEAPFVGPSMQYEFSCPRVDPSAEAVLLFQSQGGKVGGSLDINGQKIHGGIPSSIDLSVLPTSPLSDLHLARWTANIMLVGPGILTTSNVLQVRAVVSSSGEVDDFVLDNAVVLFKTLR
jgi:hypothetical protein